MKNHINGGCTLLVVPAHHISAGKNKNQIIMKEHSKAEWGLVPLEEREMLQNGGMSLRELWQLLSILGEAVKKAEKYWPKFKEGFVEGWEAA
ncbi:MAG: hypothetical protein EOM16_00260 [Bacteroidia bacterium]|nr:hypothetical protein [Bacteroidales bacterium]MDD3843764.1 hypothetical protein [Bacteroidales bacterium]MDD4617524.1 hypothetical protein [Bacteroidales bacterium]NCC45455.1 hypothetical protein [Bacteroidia bacterium]